MDVFDQVPSDSKIFGDGLNHGKPEHIEHRQGERSNEATGSGHEGQTRPPQRGALPALQTVEIDLQQTLLSSDRTHMKIPAFLTFKAHVPNSALGTSDPLVVHLDAEHNPVGYKMSCFILNTFQAKSMVEYRRGHGLGSSVLFDWRQTTRTLPCPFLFFN